MLFVFCVDFGFMCCCSVWVTVVFGLLFSDGWWVCLIGLVVARLISVLCGVGIVVCWMVLVLIWVTGCCRLYAVTSSLG